MRALSVGVILSLIFSLRSVAQAVSSNPTPNCTAITTCTITFTYSGDYYSWTVPAGITSVTFDASGAAGGVGKNATTGTGGNGYGGRVQGTLTVTPSSALFIYIGGSGGSGSGANNGGFNGGGNGASTGNYYGGGGGGATDIRTSTSSSTRLVVAAGGGGGGYDAGNTQDHGGAGGDLTGAQGYHFGSAKAGGATQSAGGTGETYSGWNTGATGTSLTGGAAGSSTGGGGGGGGYFGGGGGSWGGGGGGSSYTNGSYVTSPVHTQGYQSGSGVLSLTYQNPTTSSTTLALTGNVKVATFRTSITITATVDQPGKVTFYSRAKKIAGCVNVVVVSTSATCTWKPESHGNQTISAKLTPSNGAALSSAQLNVSVSRRTNSR